jgi:hypothetical protein
LLLGSWPATARTKGGLFFPLGAATRAEHKILPYCADELYHWGRSYQISISNEEDAGRKRNQAQLTDRALGTPVDRPGFPNAQIVRGRFRRVRRCGCGWRRRRG